MGRLAAGLIVFLGLSVGAASGVNADPGDLLATYSGTVHGFALNPSNAELYASTDTGVLVIDTASLELVATIPVPDSPRGLAVSPDGTTLYVATVAAAQLAVIDISSLSLLGPIPLPVISSDVEAGNGGRVYVTPGNTGSLHGIMQVDATTGTFEMEFTLGVSVWFNGLLEISPDRNFLYFGNRGLSPGTLAKFDVSTDAPVKLFQNGHGDLGGGGNDLWLTPDGEYVYYAVGGGNGTLGYDIARIRTSDMTVQGALLTGAFPREITTSPDGKIAYAVHQSGHIDVWETETQTGLGEYATNGQAIELIVDRSGKHLFAAFPDELRVYQAECSNPLVDDDGDGVSDCVDNCPSVSNPNQENTDGDPIGDACNDDRDADGDEWADHLDTCPSLANPAQVDTDLDGLGDFCDNCPLAQNPDQLDVDPPNGVGDVCEDSDGDGLSDLDEVSLYGTDPSNPDTDADGLTDGEEVHFLGTSPVDFDPAWNLGGSRTTRFGSVSESGPITGRLWLSDKRTYVIQIDGDVSRERGVWFENRNRLLFFPQNLLEIVQAHEQEIGAEAGEPVQVSLSRMKSKVSINTRSGVLSMKGANQWKIFMPQSAREDRLSESFKLAGSLGGPGAAASLAAKLKGSAAESVGSETAGGVIAAVAPPFPVAIWTLTGKLGVKIGLAKGEGPLEGALVLMSDRTYILGSTADEGGEAPPEIGVWFEDRSNLLLIQQNLLEAVEALEKDLSDAVGETVELDLTRQRTKARVSSKTGDLSLRQDTRFNAFFPQSNVTLRLSTSVKASGTPFE